MNLNRSKQLFAKALEIIPGGTNTISKRVYEIFEPEYFPAYIEKADGAYVWDIDGNKYIDYIASLSPINIGYNNKRIKEKIKEQLEKGSIFSLPCANEVELSELLIDKIPCAEMVRFLKSGAEVTSAAVRVARLVTGKEMVLSCGYQGWHDWWSAKTGTKGIPECYYKLIADFSFNDFAALEKLVTEHEGKIACIIMTAADYGLEPKNDFLEKTRKLTDDKGILLIFDEIVTGFRWAMGGAQEKYKVVPDLAAFAKGMANGMPIAAIVGKKEYMSLLKDNFVTSTFASEALSIAASLETIRILEEEKIIPRLYQIANNLRNGLKQISQDQGVMIDLFDPTPTVKFKINIPNEEQQLKATFEFMKYCTAHGILIRRYKSELFLCPIAALTDDDVDVTLNVFNDALAKIN